MKFADVLTIDRSHRTADGFLRVVAKGARSGIQQYLGREVDPEGKHFAADETVNVYRPASEVFDQKVLASFVGRPITDDHPSVAVTAKNWRDHSRGVIGGAVKDGEWIRFDLALMDADLIAKVDAGKQELSCGYGCSIDVEDGEAPDGTKFQAVQRGIVGNHLAVVDRARAGSEARISDAGSDGGNASFECCDAATIILDAPETKPMPHVLIIDGLQVPNVSDEAKAAITKLQGQLADAQTAQGQAVADLAVATKALETKDGELAALKTQLADAQDPAKQAVRDAARAKVIVGAQMLKPGIVVDARSDADIRKEAVTAYIGDAAKDMSDAAIEGAFAAATKDAKPADQQHQAIRMPTTVADASEVRNLARAMQYN